MAVLNLQQVGNNTHWLMVRCHPIKLLPEIYFYVYYIKLHENLLRHDQLIRIEFAEW